MTIYFIGGDFDAVKIGYTADDSAALRLRDLQCGNPNRLRIIAEVFGTREDERSLHREFASRRLSGEWFQRNSLLESRIEQMRQRSAEQTESWIRPDETVHMTWDRVSGIWASLTGTDPDDGYYVIHAKDPSIRFTECRFARVQALSVLLSSPGLQKSSSAIVRIRNDIDSSLSFWIQAFIRCHVERGPVTVASIANIERVFKGAFDLLTLAEARFSSPWSDVPTTVLPVYVRLPERAELTLREFLQYVSMCRAMVWSNYRIVEVSP